MPDPAAGHDRDLATAFDGQAAQFECAPVQTDPQALARLVSFADLSPDALVLDAGCGPGLVARALLEAGHRVFGVDLSAEMVARARLRCQEFGERATFAQGSVFGPVAAGPFDAAISRFVLHHVADPLGFVARQVELVRPGGVVVVADHTTDPAPALALEHQWVERLRDRTHTRCLTGGELVDLLATAGLERIRLVEESLNLDFDEWFDRGTPVAAKADVRTILLGLPPIRGFQVEEVAGGRVAICCWRATVRGEKRG
jgi:2-polyprenyl-3-methyl-5-hydroxy-6-metoxy-1,4-benzoquinol methylase